MLVRKLLQGKSALLLLCLLGVLPLGCIAHKTAPKGQPAPQAAGPQTEGHTDMAEASQLYRQAEQMLHRGEYDGAAQTFSQVLSSPGADADLQRGALYGRTIARLIGADTPGQFDHAMQEWQVWLGQLPEEQRPETEDPALMTELLQRLRNALADNRTEQDEALQAARQQNEELSAQADLQAQELNLLRARNQELLNKIRALEDLQQEIDIKRKGILSQ